MHTPYGHTVVVNVTCTEASAHLCTSEAGALLVRVGRSAPLYTTKAKWTAMALEKRVSRCCVVCIKIFPNGSRAGFHILSCDI